MNQNVLFATDAGGLAIFDPVVLKGRLHDEVDWMACDFSDIPEVTSGQIGLVGLGGDGFFSARVTTGSFTNEEKLFLREVVEVGVQCQSGHIFVGNLEALPGGGAGELEEFLNNDGSGSLERGQLLELPTGNYNLKVYSIDVPDELESQYSDVADFNLLITISPRSGEFTKIESEPELMLHSEDTFLFPSPVQEAIKKVTLGLEVYVKVVKSGDETLRLKHQFARGKWPAIYDDYRMLLQDMSVVQWHDRLRVKTVSVDENSKIIFAELLEKELPENSPAPPSSGTKGGFLSKLTGFFK